MVLMAVAVQADVMTLVPHFIEAAVQVKEEHAV
jgi:hypothetical protein